MPTDIPYRVRVMAGIVAIVAVLGLVVVILGVSDGKFSSGYRVSAVFGRAGQGLYPGNAVKIRGVNVGTVVGFHLDASDHVVIVLHMNAGVRVPSSVTASVEPLSVFGPTYVDLLPGADEVSGPYLGAGAVITRTSAGVSLLDVLDKASTLLNSVDTADLSTVVNTLGMGLTGTGADLAQTIQSSGTIASHAVADLPELNALVTQLAAVVGTVASHGGDINTIAASLDQALPAITSNPDEVSALLNSTSALAADVSSLLEGHQAALDQVVNGLTTVVTGLYPDRGGLPPLVLSLNEFFGFIGGILRAPGEAIPGGLIAGNIEGFLPSDPCQAFTPVSAP